MYTTEDKKMLKPSWEYGYQVFELNTLRSNTEGGEYFKLYELYDLSLYWDKMIVGPVKLVQVTDEWSQVSEPRFTWFMLPSNSYS